MVCNCSCFLAIKHASEAMKKTGGGKAESAGSIVLTASGELILACFRYNGWELSLTLLRRPAQWPACARAPGRSTTPHLRRRTFTLPGYLAWP